MGFVYEDVGEENRELWESIGWRDWGEKFLVYRAAARESEINSITVNIQCEPECV